MFKTRVLKEIEFNTPGETVEGRLMQANTIRYSDGGTNVDYLVHSPGRGIVSFRGSSQLNKMLFKSDVGLMVRITYRGNDAAPVKAGMSPKKMFEVLVDEESGLGSAPANDPSDPGITDADLPANL